MTQSPPDSLQEDDPSRLPADDPDPTEDFPYEVEMSLFDHLDELRQRLIVALAAVTVTTVGSFFFINKIVSFLQLPAGKVKFIQTAPGEYFFVSFKAAAYVGILLAAPVILYQVIQFILPALSRRERRFVLPVVIASSLLFALGLVFAYYAMIPAAMNFFVSYGAGVVEQNWTIDKYFDLVFVILLSTGLVFEIPVLQVLLGVTGLVSSKQMFANWRYIILGAVVLG
ncbi:MAG: twin-arginine translocase subunit TatC, partial [Gloeobacterales cyanobacterium]